MLAAELGEFLGCRSYTEIRRELADLGDWTGHRSVPPMELAGSIPSTEDGLVLATWRHLLDSGSMQDGEPFLAGTAPKAVAKVSAATAAGLGVADGDVVDVTAGTLHVRLPLEVAVMADHVVWLPTCSPGCDIRALLGDSPLSHVLVSKGGVA